MALVTIKWILFNSAIMLLFSTTTSGKQKYALAYTYVYCAAMHYSARNKD